MTPLLEVAAPYPWHREDARALHLALVTSFPTVRAAVALASAVGIAEYTLNVEQSAESVWRQILDEATRRVKLRPLVENAAGDGRAASHMALFQALLAAVPPPRSAEPTSASGAVAYLSGSTEISHEESLLFRVDLTLPTPEIEKLVGTLGVLLERARAVCRLVGQKVGPEGAVPFAGTGFRIGGDWILTNHHVLRPEKADVTELTAEFPGGTSFPARLDTVVTEPALDWGVVRVPGPPERSPIIDLAETSVPKLGGSAYIVQYPLGGAQRIGFVRNTIVFVQDPSVHYLTDTQQGSSGAPVFDGDGKLIALHHRGGNPVTLAGQTPVKKNEGILIERVIASLAEKGVDYGARA